MTTIPVSQAIQTLRETIEIFRKIEKQESSWPDGVKIFNGASYRAQVSLETLIEEIGRLRNQILDERR